MGSLMGSRVWVFLTSKEGGEEGCQPIAMRSCVCILRAGFKAGSNCDSKCLGLNCVAASDVGPVADNPLKRWYRQKALAACRGVLQLLLFQRYKRPIAALASAATKSKP
jgi:hypothetical protein